MDDPFMQDKVGTGSIFPLDHEFPTHYDLEEEDEVDIDGEPLFEDELAKQARANKKHKSKRTKAYMQPEDKLLYECWRDIGQDPKIGTQQKACTFRLRVQREYHERKKSASYQMESKRGRMSLSK
ncbi:Eyes absent-like protein 4 [Hordeum vulgare]|nr:Eyes absent-like protein 4 [Hordeum vulgare]